MKIHATHTKAVNPTSTDNQAAGYGLGQWWENTVTGEKFYQKTDGVWASIGVADTTVNLEYNRNSTSFQIINSKGTGVIIPLADINNAGLLSPTEKTAIGTISTKENSITGSVVTSFWSGLKTWVDFATTVRASVLTGLSTATTTVAAATDTLLVAIGKLQGQISLKALAADIFTGTDVLKIPTAKSINDAVFVTERTSAVTTAGAINDLTRTNLNSISFTTTVSAVTLSGLATPSGGVEVTLINNTSFPLTLLHNSTLSVAANRLSNLGGVSVVLPIGGIAVYKYDNLVSLWRMVSVNQLTQTQVNFIDPTSSIQTQFNTLNTSLTDRATASDILTGTDVTKIPTAKSINDALIATDKELVINTAGAIANQPTAVSKLIRFTAAGQVILSGFADPFDGKLVTIINNTTSPMSLLHNSTASLTVNRLRNTNNADLVMAIGSVAQYRYSQSQSAWIMIDLWATDFFNSLTGSLVKRAVSVAPTGYAIADEIIELKTWDTTRTVVHTKTTLNSSYPTFKKGQQVVCPNVIVGGLIYEKYDDLSNDWISFPIVKVV